LRIVKSCKNERRVNLQFSISLFFSTSNWQTNDVHAFIHMYNWWIWIPFASFLLLNEINEKDIYFIFSRLKFIFLLHLSSFLYVVWHWWLFVSSYICLVVWYSISFEFLFIYHHAHNFIHLITNNRLIISPLLFTLWVP
jgi:hypothetical protein